jgi:hypothetical protein
MGRTLRHRCAPRVDRWYLATREQQGFIGYNRTMRVVRPLPLLLLSLSLRLSPMAMTACGGAKAATSPPAPPAPSAASSLPAPPPAAAAAATAAPAPAPMPFDFGLPADAAMTVAIDLSKLGDADAQKAWPPLQSLLEDLAGLAHAPSLHDLLANAGVDDRRTLAMAVLAVDEDARHAIEALTPIVPAAEPERRVGDAPPPPPTTHVYATMHDVLAAMPRLARARILVPASDPSRLRGAIDAAMTKAGWTVGPTGHYSNRHGAATATAGDGVVALDFAVGETPAVGLASISAAAAAKRAEWPETGGPIARVSYAPKLLAEQSFLSGVTTTVGAVSGESIRPDQRERIAAEGLWESAQNFALAKGPRGERWSRVELSVSMAGGRPSVRMRAEAGPGFALPPADAWTPSFTVTPTSTDPRTESPSFDLSRAFLAGWTLPGGADGATLRAKPFFDMIHRSGPLALFIALPDLAVTAPGLLNGHDELAPKPEVLGRFARYGLTQGGSLFYGILPDGTTRASAECVLLGPAPCGAGKLTLGAKGEDGSARVSLVQVDHRFVLLRTSDRDGLAVRLKGASVGPVRASLDLRRTPLPFAGMFPFTAVETVRRDGNSLVAEIAVH